MEHNALKYTNQLFQKHAVLAMVEL